MTTMREYRINSSRLVNAPALLKLGKKTYQEKGLVDSYNLVYNMFPGIDRPIVERLLNGDIPTYSRGSTVIYFLEEEEIVNG